MKKLAILGSGFGSNFEAVARYLKDVEIICISDKPDAYILKRAEYLNIPALVLTLDEMEKYFSENKFDLVALAGFMRIIPENILSKMGRCINLHPSILPAFKGKDAIKQAYLYGVKVTGITIHEVTPELDSGRIIAQYPVIINDSMHYDELEETIHRVEHIIYPQVIEKLLNNAPVEYGVSFGNCGGRGKCEDVCGGKCKECGGGCEG